jgi:hypothetical protein
LNYLFARLILPMVSQFPQTPRPLLPVELRLGLLQDAQARDPVTARRAALLELLWNEAYLSAAGLISRTEWVVGRGCFGKAPAATLKRDLRALKAVLAANGWQLRYSRRPGRRGYYLRGRPELAPEIAANIRAGMSDIDPYQVELASRLTPAQRVQQAGELSDQLRMMAVRRRLAENPSLTLREAHREVMRSYERWGG